ncbi:hypothetical protein AAG570_008671 [Ranatra chinensis]|uniref:Uncharacterized protein n=1 Tax=Ranatra chinensis TaxID=642074 RepID=A0ABD0ZCR2_9HEMI
MIAMISPRAGHGANEAGIFVAAVLAALEAGSQPVDLPGRVALSVLPLRLSVGWFDCRTFPTSFRLFTVVSGSAGRVVSSGVTCALGPDRHPIMNGVLLVQKQIYNETVLRSRRGLRVASGGLVKVSVLERWTSDIRNQRHGKISGNVRRFNRKFCLR